MSNKTNLNDMMLFIAVIDAGSFTIAADRLNIPKANLSRKISRLEQDLGIMLLERTTRSQHITEAGKQYLTHCRRIQQEVELAEATIEQTLNTVSGDLRISASVGLGHEILKSTLGKFMHEFPDINLQLDLNNRRIDLIEEGVDMAIRVGQLEDSRLIAKCLGSISRKIYASPNYLCQHNEISAIEQVAQHDFLLMSSAHNGGKLILHSPEHQHELSVTPKMQIDDFTILKQMVVEGIGLAVIPDYMCKTELQEGLLVQVLPDWGMSDIDVYSLYPKHRLNLPKVKVFMAYIQAAMEQKLIR